jgi:drug/metabolite transporter (DMT)-like permease
MSERFYQKVSQNLHETSRRSPSLESKRRGNNKLKRFKGFFFAILAAFCFPSGNLFIKKAHLLNGFQHLVVFYVFKLTLILLVNAVARENPLGKKKVRCLLTARGIFGTLGGMFLYIGLVIIPISDSSAISHSSIIITAVLSRIILKEKLGPHHLLSLVLTIVGVLLISKPTFLFASINSAIIKHSNVSSFTFNNGTNQSKLAASNTPGGASSELIFLLGVLLVFFSAFFYGSLHIIIKKLCNYKIKWFVVTIYDCYFGLPSALVVSYLIYQFKLFNYDGVDIFAIDTNSMLMQLLYSCLSAFFILAGQVSVNLSLIYENPTKVSIIKAFDTVVAFCLQIIILKIKVDKWSLLGSISILIGVFIVFLFKLLDKVLVKKKAKAGKNKNILLRLYFLKF